MSQCGNDERLNEKLKVRMSANERDWWVKRIEKEEKHVKLWESLSEDDY